MGQRKRFHFHSPESRSVPIHRLCWLALSCAGAMLLSIRLSTAITFFSGLICLAAFTLSCFLPGSLRQKGLWAAAGLALGFFWTGSYQYLVRTPARALISDEAVPYTLVVTGYPRETAYGASLPARIIIDEGKGPRIQLYTEESALDFLPGDRICTSLRIVPSDLSRGQEVDYHEAKGIFLLGYGREEPTLMERPASIPLLYWPAVAAAALKESITTLFPEDVSGFLLALTTGDKSALPQGLYAAFQRAGLAHIVAVSGLHIGFLAGLFSALFRKRNPFAVVAEILFIFLFAAMAGNSPSALRAAFMASFLLIAPLIGRENDPPTTLSAALLFLLLPCPYAVSSVGLQLSFAAMAGIYGVGLPLFESWSERLPTVDKQPGILFLSLLRFSLASLSTTMGALFFTLPLTALYFRSVSLVLPVSNLLILGLVSIAFLGCLTAVFLGFLSPFLGHFVASLVARPARWIIYFAQSLARFSFSSISLLSGYLSLWFLVAYLLLLLWYAGRKQVRPLIPAGAMILSLLAAFLVQSWQLQRYPLVVTALDVGQGASTLFYSKGETLLVDCGGNRFDNAGDLAANRLQSMGCSKLDTLILTHCHSDHANGVLELLSRIPVTRLILPDVDLDSPMQQEILQAAKAANCQIEILTEDTILPFGDAHFSLYAPLGNGGSNEEGLSLLCSLGSYDILLTGDMNGTVEKRLVKYKNLPDIELLMVGHHGSASATSEELLLATLPETAVISSGYNTYGHPSPEILERLGALDCAIYRTDGMGDITFYINGGIEE